MEINKYFNLQFERADDATIAKRLIGGAKIKGPALVTLILSIFIASIGLNMNSTAVVIGAMLISPLMGPILAIGFGFATLNFTVAKSGILRLSVQITIAVLASALYFYISPVQTATSELLARTEPNIFDVFIAIFGGLAGIIGQTRKTLDNVIPGVAIATALMPPLCTAGYGLASGNWTYFFGASYLFFINAFFIFFAAFIVLKGVYSLPFHEQAEERIRRNQLIFLVIGLIMAIPSIYAGYDMTIKYSESNHLEQFIKNDINQDGRRQVIDYSLDRTNKLVDIVAIGAPVTSEERAQLDDKLQKDDYLQPYTLRFVTSVDEKKSTMDKVNSNKSSENLEKYKNLSNLYQPTYELVSETINTMKTTDAEAKALFPFVSKVEGMPLIDNLEEPKASRYMVIVHTTSTISDADLERIKAWLEAKLSAPVIISIEQTKSTL
ncbi:DUF389 domain-containing protein [Veillonella sp.]|uniref:DUF389 domain-containing protein n=1 Tax=Veillonella sp. TaxID=1926307 RepID=UPI002912F943|nr:DUF389 domain-containing protein [Veillonella sp.]MDU3433743.1 DUF389 domain-containing protein [Veillonella sp.]MDU5494567.1 DUF389 domain-containing protein [Veillonella sp.]MDU6206348.1 DUF389 domain-containing protein [Veillonella sp.]